MRILFLCYGNACRSIMAETLARHFLANRIEAASAGLDPLGYIPDSTLEALKEVGISTDGLYSKSLFSMRLGDFDYIVNLTEYKVGADMLHSFAGKLVSHPVSDPFGKNFEAYRATRDEVEWFLVHKLRGIIGDNGESIPSSNHGKAGVE